MTQPIERKLASSAPSYCSYGPVKVPKEVFQDYIREDGPNYSDPTVIFDGWTDETNSDDLRRLIIRDIVRQTRMEFYPYAHDGHACYETPCNLDEILIGGAGGVEELRKLLRTRPKLLRELTEEFLYALGVELRVQSGLRHRAIYDRIIAILLSAVTDEELGRQLWSYHSCSSYITSQLKTFDLPTMAFPLTTDAVQAPAWLRTEILDYIAAYFRHPASTENPATILPESDLPHGNLGYYGISHLFDELPYNYKDGKYTEHDLHTILQIAEENLPANGTYLRQDFIIKVVPTISDELIALRVAKRHVRAYAASRQAEHNSPLDELRTRAGRTFLYWLYGAVSYHTPSDHDMLQNVSDLIALTSEPQV